MSLAWFLAIYIFGGLTFLPAVLVAFYYFSKWHLPDADTSSEYTTPNQNEFSRKRALLRDTNASSNSGNAKSIDNASYNDDDDDDKNSLLEKELETGTDVYMTGWLTVSREYFIYPTGGPKNSLNPPSSDKNDASIEQNVSAYSSLYKLVNSSRSQQSSSSGGNSNSNNNLGAGDIEPNNEKTSKNSKKTKKSLSKLSKYFAVLRHGNLFLFSDSDQANVKHVIVIARHVVMMWPPNVSDGEMFIKRSAICLAKLGGSDNEDSSVFNESTPPKDAFYLYSDNCSEKEDFYFALIRASKKAAAATDFGGQNHRLDPNIMARPLHYKTTEIMDLIQTLHSTDANLQTRWLNAIIGRLFLSLKDTSKFENFFRNKIVNKLARVKRPNYLGDIQVKRINCGHEIPYFTHPRLKDLTPEGLMIVEANVSYAGNFAVEIATKAILNLGTRFKARDVSLVLSTTLRSIEGKMIFMIKPPPSNRIWYAFESMPKLNLVTEPVVSSKQITYSMVTKAIENRFREVFKETLVLPFMDDLTFYDTSGEFYRAGIWDPSLRPSTTSSGGTTKIPEPSSEEGGTSNAQMFSQSSTEGLRHRSTSEHDDDTYSDIVDPPSSTAGFEKEDDLANDTTSVLSMTSSLSSGSPPSRAQTQMRSTGGNSASAMLGSVKKWGNWYFKDKAEKLQQTIREAKEAQAAQRQLAPSRSNMSLRRERSNTDGSSSGAATGASFKPAPAAHNFPPELLNKLDKSTTPYGPAPEMKVPEKYPVPPPPPAPLSQPPKTFAKRKPVVSASSQAPESNLTPLESKEYQDHDGDDGDDGDLSGELLDDRSQSVTISSALGTVVDDDMPGGQPATHRYSVVSLDDDDDGEEKDYHHSQDKKKSGIFLSTSPPTAGTTPTTIPSSTNKQQQQLPHTIKRKPVTELEHDYQDQSYLTTEEPPPRPDLSPAGSSVYSELRPPSVLEDI